MARIRFVTDSHYGRHCGANLLPAFDGHEVAFAEDDWTLLEEDGWTGQTDLLALHMIAGTCDNPLPGPAAEAQVRAWCEAGRPLLLLHGSSAAFWHWDWWRPEVGWRWVRPEDPDNTPRSTHPVRPYRCAVSKTRHPLAERLSDLDIPDDEIYIELEQVCPSWTLMETTTDEGTFPMSHIHQNSWGGWCCAFLPGHAPEVTSSEPIRTTVRTLTDWLIEQV